MEEGRFRLAGHFLVLTVLLLLGEPRGLKDAGLREGSNTAVLKVARRETAKT